MEDIKNIDSESKLIQTGANRMDWIRSRMFMLERVRREFKETRPFAGHRIGMSLHLEPKTAVLLETLAAGGAEIVATGNHGSTQDDIVAFLRSQGMKIFGARADSLEQHHKNIAAVLDSTPDVLLDNGADLVAGIAERGAYDSVLGGTEETTSGGLRLRDQLREKVPYPVIVINDSLLKAIGENRHAVGQSVVESLMRITNLMIPGKHFAVVGYGWCGRGVAQYLRALGGIVTVVETDILKSFEAALDGHRVDSAKNAAAWADVVITATGQNNVFGSSEFRNLRNGVVLANCGHFPWEIDVESLKNSARSVVDIDGTLERIELDDGRKVVLVADGRMFNLAGNQPKGNSIESMDLGFMLQALSLEYVVKNHQAMQNGAQCVPRVIEEEIARRLLDSMDVSR
ncbi:adenosylhomocysteinase [Paraburkholderia susongensis]|uniref:Adenosylhomocysteinase n=1 Tax=Paraburkholderia susongensis TaxID=1515439 RepID=A0A1X7M1F4_9BURK|nr:adenosylhomocysteinase [Paraburkholderia susongensis]SMG59557.1 adenosylhomocysteinase [Paraburkholderia susongensis]